MPRGHRAPASLGRPARWGSGPARRWAQHVRRPRGVRDGASWETGESPLRWTSGSTTWPRETREHIYWDLRCPGPGPSWSLTVGAARWWSRVDSGGSRTRSRGTSPASGQFLTSWKWAQPRRRSRGHPGPVRRRGGDAEHVAGSPAALPPPLPVRADP